MGGGVGGLSVAIATTSCYSVEKQGGAEIYCLQGRSGGGGGDSPKMGLIVQTSIQTDRHNTHTVKQMLVASFMSMNKLSRGLLHGWRVIQRTVTHKRVEWVGRGGN